MPNSICRALLCLVALTSLIAPCFSACHVYESTWEDYKTVVLENEIVKVVLIPDSNGRIAEYLFKPTRTNQLPKLVLNEFEVDADLRLSTSNYAGYEDWIWELGIISFRDVSAKYSWKILASTDDKCSVQLVRNGSYSIERTLTLRSGTSALDVTTTISNLSDTEKTYSYWAHLMVNPGGGQEIRDIALFAPLAKNDGKVRGIDVVKSDRDTVYSRGYDGSTANTFIPPSQSWWGAVDRKRDTAIISLIPVEELAGDGFLYNFSMGVFTFFESGYSMSMEAVYSSTKFKPQAKRDYHMSIAACRGLNNILYADKNIAIGANTMPLVSSAKKMVLQLNVGSFDVKDGAPADVELLDGSGRVVAKTGVKLPKLSPESAVPVTLDFGSVPAGEYTLRWHAGGVDFSIFAPVTVK